MNETVSSGGSLMLTALEVEQVRRFRLRHSLDGLGPGLNLLAAPNEAGKSTLLAALKLLFTTRYSSTAKSVKDLAPYGGGKPAIHAEFSLGHKKYALEKRFLSGKNAQLRGPDGTFTGDDAEAHLQALLDSTPERGGTAGLLTSALWVTQGESFTQPALNDAAHMTVRDCLTADIGDLTGGAEAARILETVRTDLAQLVDGHRKPKGRYAAALEGERLAGEELVTLRTKQAVLAEDIQTLDQLRRQLAIENDGERRKNELNELAAAEAASEALLLFRQRETEAQSHARDAEARLHRLRDEQARRTERRRDHIAVTREITLAEAAIHEARERSARAAADLTSRREALAVAERAHNTARQQEQHAQQTIDLVRLLAARANTASHLARLEQAQTQFDEAHAALGAVRVDDGVLARALAAERARDTAASALRAQATGFDAMLEPGAAGRVTFNGQPLDTGRMELLDAGELRIEGIGIFRIEPAVRNRAESLAAMRRHEEALEAILASADCADMRQLHAAMEQRRHRAATLESARAQRDAMLHGIEMLGKKAPDDGLAALRRQLATQEAELSRLRALLGNDGEASVSASDHSTSDGMTADDARHVYEAARQHTAQTEQAVATARHALLEPDGAHRVAEGVLTEHQTALRLLRERADRLQAEDDAAQAHRADAELSALTEAAERDLGQAERALARLGEERPESSEALLSATIRRLKTQIDGARERLAALQKDCAAQEARVQTAEGLGLDEAIAGAERKQSLHRRECESCEREIATLRLLSTTLAEVERDTVERYLAPLTRAIQAPLDMLFPRARPTMDRSFGLSSLTRWQDDEPLGSLSDGTREQIAVLVRLGLADLLHSQGKPALLILDDALSFSDARRLRTMFDILSDAASRMQIIVFTCRAEAFADLPARPLRIREVEAS